MHPKIVATGKWLSGAVTAFGFVLVAAAILAGVEWAISGAKVYHDAPALGAIGLIVCMVGVCGLIMFFEEGAAIH